MPAWNRTNAKHLLSRTLFGYTSQDLDKALSMSLANFVDNELLANKPLPNSPADWVDEIPINNDPNTGTRYREFSYWWHDLMMKEGTSMREKMVLFWHNHYTSQRSVVNYPQHFYIQQSLFRKNAFGNFKDFTKQVTKDPAMLIYLNGRQNTRSAPNENYARELLELFTIGVGNYTETDIKQAARALTGWQVVGLTAVFNDTRYDAGEKTFMGKTGKFDDNAIVDIIFEQEKTAEFLSRKLFKEFAYYQPNETFVKQMAKVLRDNKYEVKPLLSFLFKSEEFYKTEYIGAKIKSPIELIIGTLKHFNASKYLGNEQQIDWAYIYDTGRNMTQQLFEPPNVKGWQGQRNWISTNTYPIRNAYTDVLLAGRKGGTANWVMPKIDTLAFARSHKNPEDAKKLVDDIVDIFMQFPISAKKRQFLLDTLLDGTVLDNWSTYTPMADVRVQRLMRTLMRLPEYQLS